MSISDPYCVVCGAVNDLHVDLYCRRMQEQRRVYMSIINHYKLALERIAEGRQLRAALKRVDALEEQMRREGWTQEDLDEIKLNVNY